MPWPILMSRFFGVLDKFFPAIQANAGIPASSVNSSDYTDLIRELFHGPSVVAIVGASFGNGVTPICEGIASGLSDRGKRVVLVSVRALLQTNTLAAASQRSVSTTLFPFRPRRSRRVGRNVWLWPSPLGLQVESPKGIVPAPAKNWLNWLDYLRQDFDAVLMDCPALETAPGGAAIAAMADAAVLGVDALRTSKQQILVDQRLLQVSGVRLAGCILINGK